MLAMGLLTCAPSLGRLAGDDDARRRKGITRDAHHGVDRASWLRETYRDVKSKAHHERPMRSILFALLLAPAAALAGCASDASFETLGLADWKARFEVTPDALLLDVRTLPEYEAGHIPGATLIPYDEIRANATRLPEDKATPIFVYCRSGTRSTAASETLVAMGYTNVVNMDGGFPDWAQAGYPAATGAPA